MKLSLLKQLTNCLFIAMLMLSAKAYAVNYHMCVNNQIADEAGVDPINVVFETNFLSFGKDLRNEGSINDISHNYIGPTQDGLTCLSRYDGISYEEDIKVLTVQFSLKTKTANKKSVTGSCRKAFLKQAAKPYFPGLYIANVTLDQNQELQCTITTH